MKCPTCESCEYAQYCGATEIMRKCERHNKKVEQTKAEYMRQCDDTNLAWEIWQLVKDGNTDSLYSIEEWLQEKHND